MLGRVHANAGYGKPDAWQYIRKPQAISYVIPSVAEESKNLEMESGAGILDSSATLGMT